VYNVSDVVFFILRALGGAYGLMKIVYLTFLTDYEQVGDTVLKYFYGGEPLSRANYFVWTRGPMSNEVFRVVYGDAVKAKMDRLGRVLLYTDEVPNLPVEVQMCLKEVLARYGELRSGQLERLVFRMLKLRSEDIDDFAGMWIDDYLQKVGLRVKPVDLQRGANALYIH